MPKQTKQLANTAEYKNLLQELRDILAKGQYTAYKAVDNIRVQTYWQIGERIVREELKHRDRADYGKHLIDNLVIDLDFQKSLLYDIVNFYKAYENFHAVRGELSWTHYRRLIALKSEEERTFYQNQVSYTHGVSERYKGR